MIGVVDGEVCASELRALGSRKDRRALLRGSQQKESAARRILDRPHKQRFGQRLLPFRAPGEIGQNLRVDRRGGVGRERQRHCGFRSGAQHRNKVGVEIASLGQRAGALLIA